MTTCSRLPCPGHVPISPSRRAGVGARESARLALVTRVLVEVARLPVRIAHCPGAPFRIALLLFEGVDHRAQRSFGDQPGERRPRLRGRAAPRCVDEADGIQSARWSSRPKEGDPENAAAFSASQGCQAPITSSRGSAEVACATVNSRIRRSRRARRRGRPWTATAETPCSTGRRRARPRPAPDVREAQRVRSLRLALDDEHVAARRDRPSVMRQRPAASAFVVALRPASVARTVSSQAAVPQPHRLPGLHHHGIADQRRHLHGRGRRRRTTTAASPASAAAAATIRVLPSYFHGLLLAFMPSSLRG